MDNIKKPRKLKCSLCKELFEKEELTIKGSKKYCNECLKIEEKKNEKNMTDWDLLFNYICKVYNIKTPTGMMFKQLKDFRGDDYNYTNIGMYYTLKYYCEIIEGNILDGSGLGIIPYYYDRAKAHYNKVYDLEEMVNNFHNTEQNIKIKTKIQNKRTETKMPLPLDIDWEELNESDKKTD